MHKTVKARTVALLFAVLATSATAASPAAAQDVRSIALIAAGAAPVDTTRKKPVTSFTGDLGFVSATGNTNVTTLTVGDKIVHTDGYWMFTQAGTYVSSETNNKQSANQLRLGVRADYALQAAAERVRGRELRAEHVRRVQLAHRRDCRSRVEGDRRAGGFDVPRRRWRAHPGIRRRLDDASAIRRRGSRSITSTSSPSSRISASSRSTSRTCRRAARTASIPRPRSSRPSRRTSGSSCRTRSGSTAGRSRRSGPRTAC